MKNKEQRDIQKKPLQDALNCLEKPKDLGLVLFWVSPVSSRPCFECRPVSQGLHSMLPRLGAHRTSGPWSSRTCTK